MTRLIFNFFVITALVLPMPVIAHAQSGLFGEENSGSASDTTNREVKPIKATPIREHVKAERAAREKALADFKAEKGTRQLPKAQELADKLIKERTTAIAKLSETGQTKKCRAAAKTEVDAAISAVNTRLKEESTTVPTLKNVDAVKEFIKTDLVGKNKVFSVLIAAARGACIADGLIGKIDSKLMPAAARLKAKGFDTTTIDTELAAAKTEFQAAYTGYLKILQNPGTSTRADLAAPKQHLKDGKTHLVAARAAFNALKETTTPSPEKTPEPSSTE